jgi:hypothetical protein
MQEEEETVEDEDKRQHNDNRLPPIQKVEKS